MRTVLVVVSASLIVASLLAGCTRENTGLSIGGGDGGTDLGLTDGGAACSSLPESACKLRPDCRVDSCPTCSGGTTFIDCARKTDPPIGCGLDCPAPCSV